MSPSQLPSGFTLDPNPVPQGFTLDQPPPTTGQLLPVSRDAQGNISFDPTAGILGDAISAVTLPGDVFTGKVDPMSPQGMARAAQFGQFVSPTTPGAAWFKAAKVPVPSSAELLASGAAGKDLARSLGVVYDPQAIVALAGKTQGDLLQKGLGPKVASLTNGILDDLQKVPAGGQADYATTIDAARRNLGSIAQNAKDGSDRAAATQAIKALDQFIAQPPPQSVVAGPAATLREVASDANADYAAGSRSKTIEALGKRADVRAAAANSGFNVDNSVRSRVASFIQPAADGGPSLAERSGFTPTEIDMLQNVVNGTATTNTLRTISNLLGGGGGLGAMASGAIGGAAATAATHNPLMMLTGIVPPATGLLARTIENAKTRGALNDAAQTLRTRSPLYNDRAAFTGPIQTSPAARAQILRTLLLGPDNVPVSGQPYVSPVPLPTTTGGTLPAGSTIY